MVLVAARPERLSIALYTACIKTAGTAEKDFIVIVRSLFSQRCPATISFDLQAQKIDKQKAALGDMYKYYILGCGIRMRAGDYTQ